VTHGALESTLWKASSRLMRDFEIPWFPPMCPKCGGMLSQKMASSRLVCLACYTEFDVVEVKRRADAGRSEEKVQEEDEEG